MNPQPSVKKALDAKNWFGFEYRDVTQPTDQALTLEIVSYIPHEEPKVVGRITLDNPQAAHVFVQSVCNASQGFHRYRPPEGPRVRPAAAMPSIGRQN